MKEILERIYNRKVIAGVSAGLGEYFGIDPIIVRILFIIFTFISGIGLLVYILLWIFVPLRIDVNPNETNFTDIPESERINVIFEKTKTNKIKAGKFIFGIILISTGIVFLIDNLFPMLCISKFWPLVLIIAGFIIIFKPYLNN